MVLSLWEIHTGDQPLVATAIHHGHAVRRAIAECFAVSEADRLREEDPFTGRWTEYATNRVIAHRSRFEFDLNRPRERCVYREPEDAWGLNVWQETPSEELRKESRAYHDAFYAQMHTLFSLLARRYGRFVVYDMHSYNHRRDGTDAAPAPQAGNPDINVGTGRMSDRSRWASVIDAFSNAMRQQPVFADRPLDVRENIRFEGGYMASWANAHFPKSACVLSIEVKKFFMDEWTGMPDEACISRVHDALEATVPDVLAAIKR